MTGRFIVSDALYPEMTELEVVQVTERLLTLSKSVGRPLEVLEWGSGGSTVYFPSVLRREGLEVRWLSLEYNRIWYDRVLAAASADTTVVLFDVGNTRLKQRRIPMDEYVGYPRSLGRRYDFILVDGRKRRRCLLEAAQMLSPGGSVLLHDAERVYYHCAFSAFSHGRFLSPRLWEGRND